MKQVFISIVAKDEWPGFAALVQSIRENSSLAPDSYRFIVIAEPDAEAERWMKSRDEVIKLRPVSNPGNEGPHARKIDMDPGAIALMDVCDEGERLVHLAPVLLCLSPLNELDELEPFTAAFDSPAAFSEMPAPMAGRTAEIHPAFMVFQPSHDDYCELMARYGAAPEHFQAKGHQDVINHWLMLGYGDRPFRVLPARWNFPHRALSDREAHGSPVSPVDVKFLRYDGFKPWRPNRLIRNLGDCAHRRAEALWWPYFLRSGYTRAGTPRLGSLNPLWRSSLTSRAPRFWKERSLRLLPLLFGPLVKFIRSCPPCMQFLRAIWKSSSGILKAYRKQKRRNLSHDHALPPFIPECIRKLVVLHGPFKGMRYPALTSHGSAIYPKILGVYERELEPVIDDLIELAPPMIVDVGCAEGYYAIGLALRLPQARVIAADLSETALEMCGAMASANGVTDRVSIVKGLSSRDLERFGKLGAGLLICDCEGGEKELITEGVLSALSSWHLLIELHEFAQPGVERDLIDLVAKSHSVRIIDSIDDIRRVNVFPVPELAACDSELKKELYREGRPHPMKWLVASPVT